MFKLEADEPSSNLAKGIDKEKEVAHDLRLRNPTASVTRTSKTGDGGKDVIIEWGDKTIYYEVKNWERPMSAHDIRSYIKLHESSSAEVKIFNQGGFSEAARQTADAVGIELTAGNNYQSPSLQQRFRWLRINYNNMLRSIFKQYKNSVPNTVWRTVSMTKHAISWGLSRFVSKSIQTRKCARKRLSIRHLTLLGMISGTVWFFIQWQDDENTYEDLTQPVTLLLISSILYFLFRE
jgi:hypothetical protein